MAIWLESWPAQLEHLPVAYAHFLDRELGHMVHMGQALMACGVGSLSAASWLLCIPGFHGQLMLKHSGKLPGTVDV